MIVNQPRPSRLLTRKATRYVLWRVYFGAAWHGWPRHVKDEFRAVRLDCSGQLNIKTLRAEHGWQSMLIEVGLPPNFCANALVAFKCPFPILSTAFAEKRPPQ
jgi:hypothetical protein